MIESSLTTMLRLTFVYAVLNSSTRCCAEPEPLTREVLAAYGPGLKIRVVDQQGHPVEGAHAGFNVIRTPDGWRFGCNEDCQPTDAKGEVSLVKGSRLVSRIAMVAIHEGRGLAGIRLPSKEGEGDEPYEIVIISSRRVIGRVQIAQLDQRGQFPGWLGGTVQVGEFDPFQWISPTGDIELLLPPGDYELHARGSYGHKARRSLSVKAGAEALRLEPIYLSPTSLGLLLGKPAPEFRDIASCKNSEPLKLESLRGKHVLLVFWGHWCGPCVSHMPRIFEVYERYNREELEIIGVHVGVKENSVETTESLDELLAEIRENYWAGQDLPFPIALARSKETQHHGTDQMARSVTAADYGVMSYPTEILIDPQGNVVGEVDAALGAKDWAEMDKLLGRRQTSPLTP